MKNLFLALISVVFLNNCNTTKTTTTDKSTQNESEINGTYLVQTLYGEDVSEHKITMKFDQTNKSVSGFSGCNEYSSTCTFSQKSVSIGIPIATKRMCTHFEVEKNFFKSLSEVTKSNSKKGNDLALLNISKEQILTASKQ